MKTITADKIKKIIAQLCVKANLELRSDVLVMLKKARNTESSKRAKKLLGAIIDNANVARAEQLAICQDTGMPVVFLEVGQDVRISGSLQQAVNKGVELGYKKAWARGKSTYSPVVVHVDIVPGSKLKMTVLPKGFGCENKSLLKMFSPTAKIEEIKGFIIDAVKAAGPDACPPYVLGVGIGGTADFASLLAKKALLRKIGTRSSKIEADLLKAINKLDIGPMGLGGKTTALAVNIETYPTHIAGLPVALNFSCHALRSATATL
ncbi:MAG: fumarate hydratase [Candidatus Omnitrophica bacterium]|nr:fumarate hydratase [Candidatus Omnitrophota bacterium]